MSIIKNMFGSAKHSMPPVPPSLPFKYRSAQSITTRDYFAAKAMQAFIANREGARLIDVAEHAYTMADVMIMAREKDGAA